MNILKTINTPAFAKVRSPTGGREIIATAPMGAISTDAEKLSAVFGCMEIRSNDIGCLPSYLINRYDKQRDPKHPILFLLNIRPNVRMTPFTRRKLIRYSVYTTGNAYDWIFRNPNTGEVEELIPLTGNLVQRLLDKSRNIWYRVTDPVTGETFTVPQEDICDYKGPTHDGLNGLSVLSFAADVTRAGLAAQSYNRSFYENGGQPSGLLTVDDDLSGKEIIDGVETGRTYKDILRDEWDKYHSGAENSHRVAILDHGLKYQSLAISQKDAMFIEQQKQTVEDIARYFSMPLYKLQHGKQSYNANEQNAIEYSDSLLPEVTQQEQEQTWKLLTPGEIRDGWCIKTNMMALLRSDSANRMNFYRGMKETGAYSVNDILALEDMPAIEGGDDHAVSLNYVPLDLWRELSRLRNGGKENAK